MNEKNSIDGHTLLPRAVINKFDIKSIKIIIQSNANVNCQDLKGNTPLHYLKAEESYDRKVLKLFIDNVVSKITKGKFRSLKKNATLKMMNFPVIDKQ